MEKAEKRGLNRECETNMLLLGTKEGFGYLGEQMIKGWYEG